MIPTTAVLTEAGSRAAGSGGDEALAVVDMSGASVTLSLSSPWKPASASVPAGTVHVGVPLDDNWALSVDGRAVDLGASFGSVMSATVDRPGVATLTHDRPLSRLFWVLVQIASWSALLLGRCQPRFLRRRVAARNGNVAVDTSPVIDLEVRR
ncbi:unannotated protein [freshwater metagenome]|uniref:Unannotated protein n=1 Tax=freshwater metagenome TaxID=449393 RepID=A0A6J6G7X4_9ZZZZ|nr:hypothetical protein [Actinomycetota bacterium]